MSVKFSLAALETAKQNLDALPSTAKETRQVGLREAIRTLSPTIRKLIKKGYSRSMVVDLLKEQGITVSMSTLKQYFREKAPAADDAEVQASISAVVTQPGTGQSRSESLRGFERAKLPSPPAVHNRRLDDAGI